MSQGWEMTHLALNPGYLFPKSELVDRARTIQQRDGSGCVHPALLGRRVPALWEHRWTAVPAVGAGGQCGAREYSHRHVRADSGCSEEGPAAWPWLGRLPGLGVAWVFLKDELQSAPSAGARCGDRAGPGKRRGPATAAFGRGPGELGRKHLLGPPQHHPTDRHCINSSQCSPGSGGRKFKSKHQDGSLLGLQVAAFWLRPPRAFLPGSTPGTSVS